MENKRVQLPIINAFALTIHKVQGLSLPAVTVALNSYIFSDQCIQTPRLASAWGHVKAGNPLTPGAAKAGSHKKILVQAGLG